MARLIKKYKNRRLYDTEISQYITVEELQRYVLDGIIFRVEDSKTGTNLTAATLLQIFVEMESGASQFLSADMLRQLIVVAHHPMNQSFKGMLEQVFAALEKPAQANPYLKDYQQMTDAWQDNVQQMMKQWQGFFKS
ncbi:MAG: polyhydroxyalkanoate synthesis regulator DNA-binding domain-containing protein [Legionella sp.]|nr:polyhydroxyalkanoate synthesis regulator DNA-binding domain-containing protein [Legionella sp.]